MTIMIYGRAPSSKRRKPKGEVARKLSRAEIARFSSVAEIKPTPYRRGGTESIPSLVTNTPFVPARTSVMDAANLARESEEVRAAIIAKSKRIAPQFNKGADQYITEESDLRTLGRKIR